MINPDFWFFFNKLPTCFAFLWIWYHFAQRIGVDRASVSIGSALVVLPVGVALLPSILGALGIALLMGGSLLVLTLPVHTWRTHLGELGFTSITTLLGLVFIGRIGCWLAGCCFGEVSDLPWAIYESNPWIKHYHAQRYQVNLPLPIHPVQLYEAMGIIFLLCLSLPLRRKYGAGKSCLLLVSGYLFIWGLLDPLRAMLNTPSSLEYFGPFSLLQWGCFTASTLCLCPILVVNRRYADTALITGKLFKNIANNKWLAPILNKWLVLILPILNKWQGPTALQVNKWQGPIPFFIILFFLYFISFATSSWGTSFTKTLSSYGLVLSTLPLLSVNRTKLSQTQFESLPARTRTYIGISLGFSSVSIPLTFVAFPLLFSSPFATPHLPIDDSVSGSPWIYQIDPDTGKLGRLGRLDALTPLTEVEVEHLDRDDDTIVVPSPSQDNSPSSSSPTSPADVAQPPLSSKANTLSSASPSQQTDTKEHKVSLASTRERLLMTFHQSKGTWINQEGCNGEQRTLQNQSYGGGIAARVIDTRLFTLSLIGVFSQVDDQDPNQLRLKTYLRTIGGGVLIDSQYAFGGLTYNHNRIETFSYGPGSRLPLYPREFDFILGTYLHRDVSRVVSLNLGRGPLWSIGPHYRVSLYAQARQNLDYKPLGFQVGAFAKSGYVIGRKIKDKQSPLFLIFGVSLFGLEPYLELVDQELAQWGINLSLDFF